MRRRTLVLLSLLLSTGVACGRGVEADSGGIGQNRSTSITGPPEEGGRPPFVPPPPAPPPPTGGFGPVQVTPRQEQSTVAKGPAGTGGDADPCGAPPVLTEFTLAKAGGSPSWVAAASDGSVWFSDQGTGSVGRLEPGGAVTRYLLPEGRRPGALAADPDGSVWFGTTGPAVAHLRRDGRLVGYAVPTTTANPMGGPGLIDPGPLAYGPDGAVWFVEMGSDKVGRVDPDGIVTEYPLPERDRIHANPEGIAVGSDGGIWFSEPLTMRMGRIDPHTFAITEVVIPPWPSGVAPAGVTAGPDGALWFDGGNIGRMTTKGDVTAFPLPWQGQYSATSATAGPDGRIWMVDTRNGKVLRMTTAGAVTELPPLSDPRGLYGGGLQIMTAGPDAVWFAESSLNKVGRFPCRRAH